MARSAASDVVSFQEAGRAAQLTALPERSPPGSSQKDTQTQLPPSQQHGATPSNSAAQPAPVGGVQKEDVNW